MFTEADMFRKGLDKNTTKQEIPTQTKKAFV